MCLSAQTRISVSLLEEDEREKRAKEKKHEKHRILGKLRCREVVSPRMYVLVPVHCLRMSAWD